MSTEKYTQKTLEAIRDAQALAQEKNNQYLTPTHLLYALLNQDGGLIGSIFSRMGVDCGGLLARCLQHECDHLDGFLFVDRVSSASKITLKKKLKRLAESH